MYIYIVGIRTLFFVPFGDAVEIMAYHSFYVIGGSW